MDIIHGPHGFCVSHSIHRVGINHLVHLGRFEHTAHGDICLPDRGTGIFCLHAIQHDFAVHGLYIDQPHITNDGFDVEFKAIPVIALGIGGKALQEFCLPKLKPLSYRHVRGGKHLSVLILIAGILQPIPCFWEGGEIAILAFSTPVYKPCVVLTILSLANAFPAFFAFQIFAHNIDPFSSCRKRASATR